MKRLIKYYNQYSSDKASFSNTSTEIVEVMPELLPDTADIAELLKLAKKYKIDLVDQLPELNDKRRYNELKVSEAVQTTENNIKKGMYNNPDEVWPVYLGFIELGNKGTLKPVLKCGKKITDDQEYELFNNQEYGVMDNGEMHGGGTVLIGDHWLIPQYLTVLGYDAKEFYSRFEHTGFEDDTFRCDDCGVYDHGDDGYTYNHRILDSCDRVGINCGCYDERLKTIEVLEEYVDNANQCVEASVVEHHEASGVLVKVQTYIGGIVDGRGGCINGEIVDDGDPEKILKTLKAKNPDKQYVFVHEESGQFQTYFSVYEYRGSSE